MNTKSSVLLSKLMKLMVLVLVALTGLGVTFAQSVAPSSEGEAAQPAAGNGSPLNPLQIPGADHPWLDERPDTESAVVYDYIHVAGSTFQTRGTSSGYTYGNNGCIYRSSGSQYFNLEVNLPEDATITYLRIYAYDTSTSNQTAWLTSYDHSVPTSPPVTTDLTSVSTSWSTGHNTALSGAISHGVDNLNKAYALVWNPGATGSTMQLCGLRIFYNTP